MKNGTGENFDVPPGEYYDIDLMQPPFNLTAPLLAFNELTCGRPAPPRRGPLQCRGACGRLCGARGCHIALPLQCSGMLSRERPKWAPELSPRGWPQCRGMSSRDRGPRHVDQPAPEAGCLRGRPPPAASLQALQAAALHRRRARKVASKGRLTRQAPRRAQAPPDQRQGPGQAPAALQRQRAARRGLGGHARPRAPGRHPGAAGRAAAREERRRPGRAGLAGLVAPLGAAAGRQQDGARGKAGGACPARAGSYWEPGRPRLWRLTAAAER